MAGSRKRDSAAVGIRKLIRLQAAADIIDVHEVTIRRWIAAGRLTGYRVGPQAIRVDLAEVNALARRIETADGVA
ncbi:excisionase family DNA-binding protein [Nocardia xishanensis]